MYTFSLPSPLCWKRYNRRNCASSLGPCSESLFCHFFPLPGPPGAKAQIQFLPARNRLQCYAHVKRAFFTMYRLTNNDKKLNRLSTNFKNDQGQLCFGFETTNVLQKACTTDVGMELERCGYLQVRGLQEILWSCIMGFGLSTFGAWSIWLKSGYLLIVTSILILLFPPNFVEL